MNNRTFSEMKQKNTKKKFVKQNIKQQNEKKQISTNKICEKQNSKRENEKKSQIQNFIKIISNKFTRSRKSIIFSQLSIAFASFKKLKKNRKINNVENFISKRQKRYMIANVKKFKKKYFLFFSNK